MMTPCLKNEDVSAVFERFTVSKTMTSLISICRDEELRRPIKRQGRELKPSLPAQGNASSVFRASRDETAGVEPGESQTSQPFTQGPAGKHASAFFPEKVSTLQKRGRPMTTEELEQAVAERLAKWSAELDTADGITVRAVLAASAHQLARRVGTHQAAEDLIDLARSLPKARVMQ